MQTGPVVLLCLIFASCTFLRPVCLVKNVKCGCDKNKSIKLSQRLENKIAVDWNADYLVYLKRKKTIRKLSRFSDTKFGAQKFTKADTVRINKDSINFNKFNLFVVKQIQLRKVAVIDKETNQKLKSLSRRKYFLHCKELKSGAGGKEYKDAGKGKVIFRRRYWVT